ncbi:MAG: hypothetical protein E6240_01635 [Clostridium butyricum]|nr:hypothetical protein [Clostridium butyricum]
MERMTEYALYGWYRMENVGEKIYLRGDIYDEKGSDLYAIFDNEQEFLKHLYNTHGLMKENNKDKNDIRVYFNEPNDKSFSYSNRNKYIDKFGFLDSYYDISFELDWL